MKKYYKLYNMEYKNKYLKYKSKYMNLKNLIEQRGGIGRPYFIAYNAIITGSSELRLANEKFFSETLLKCKSEELTKIGHYAQLYQSIGNKNNEPCYDAFLALMACLPNKNFNEYFKLRKVSLIDNNKGYGKGHFKDNNKDYGKGHFKDNIDNSLKLYMKMEDDKFYTRESIFIDDILYGRKKHLFIMSPISKEAFDIINKLITNEGSNLVIHYQGESHFKDKLDNELTKDNVKNIVGMTPNGGAFNNSFNWTGGMKYGFDLRKKISSECDCYTVVMNNDFEKKQFTKDNNQIYVPQIFCEMNTYIHNNLYITNCKNSNNFGELIKLNNPTVVQDMYDRDNHASVKIISMNSKNVELCLVGREVSLITNMNKNVHIKYDDKYNRLAHNVGNGNEQKNIFSDKLLNFGKTNDSYWPEFNESITGKLSQTYNDNLTKFENHIMGLLFEKIIDCNNIKYTTPLNNRSVDNTVAIAGKEKGDVAPFNEMLFVAGLQMALKVVLNDDKYMYNSNIELCEKSDTLIKSINEIKTIN